MLFEFHLPTKIIFGVGALESLGTEAGKLGKKAMLVIDRNVMDKAGIFDKVGHDLEVNGVTTVVYGKVEPNPRASTVDEGAKIAKDERVDFVIGIGGGSTMDAAKGITVASSGSAPIWDYIENKIPVPPSHCPLLLVPTVAASGSEANETAVITNWETHEKRPLFKTFATVSIIDPALTLTLPKKPTAQGGFDIFTHLVEPYITAGEPSPLTDGILEAVMRQVVEYLPKVLVKLNDIEARTQLSWASTIAMSQLARLGGGIGFITCHVIEHPFSGFYDIAHGDGLAALIPSWMKYTFPARKERFEKLGKNVFGEADGIAATEKFLEKIGMRIRLRDLGIDSGRIDEIAAYVAKTAATVKFHPNPLDAPAIAEICRNSY
jgi:alcohol dehydrogenase